MLRRLSVLLTAAAALATAAAVTAGGPAAAAPPTSGTPCAAASSVIRVDGFAFSPPSVPAGGSSAATLTATNCTVRSQTVNETWSGRFLSDTSTGYPTGCPVYDPLPRTVTFAPRAQVVTTTTYLTFAGCTADRLRVSVSVSQGGVVLASRTADLLIQRPATVG
ncbi:hypothetical protein [Actinacidiphila paucisporea]|uniref:Uncharacterized protein n=1 Tax=Actinacidiphila paucisporea TaxID=310782 RepID=A0A1M7AL80_9ACTN|nr:hypothetical protein [Actinacidiphila paucisporea]SHL43514.1 hypothetical protein SAMN05216499_104132 [Actinacidiphila paucisporea]